MRKPPLEFPSGLLPNCLSPYPTENSEEPSCLPASYHGSARLGSTQTTSPGLASVPVLRVACGWLGSGLRGATAPPSIWLADSFGAALSGLQMPASMALEGNAPDCGSSPE